MTDHPHTSTAHTSSYAPTVLMVGPDISAIGGMATVAIALKDGSTPASGYHCEILNSGGGTGPKGWLGFPGAMLRAFRADFDLMHLHVASRGSTWRKAMFALVSKVRRKPYVIHMHGADYEGFLDSLPHPARFVVDRFYQGAARVIALGEGWRELLVTRAGARPEDTVVISNGVPEIVPAKPERHTIVFMGEVTRRKGADVLLEAAREALPALPGWTLQLVGPTPEDDIADEARQLSDVLQGQLELVGPKYGDEKTPYMAAAEIFTLPSRNEGLPMAMLEAMSAADAVVVTPVGAIDEVIADGENGRLVPAGDAGPLRDALVQLARDDEERHRLAKAGRKTWEDQFSAQHMIDAVHEVWAECLGGRR